MLLLAVSSDTTLRDMTDAFLSGCDGTDQQPAATTPTATAMASPSPTAGGGVRAPETAGSTRPASTPTPEPHGRDGPATTTPVPTNTGPHHPGPRHPDFLPAPDPGPRAATPGAITGGRTAAGNGGALRGPPLTPTPSPMQAGADGQRTTERGASPTSPGGSVLYTWQDGEHTRRVYLQTDLVLPNPATTPPRTPSSGPAARRTLSSGRRGTTSRTRSRSSAASLSYLQDQATHRAVCQDHTLALPITLTGVRPRVQRPV